MAEIHVAVSISWMGHTKKQTNTQTKKTKKHDDMLSCCATKNRGEITARTGQPGRTAGISRILAGSGPSLPVKETLASRPRQ